MSGALEIGGKTFCSRLFMGTGKFENSDIMRRAIESSGTEMVTVAMKRLSNDATTDDILSHIDRSKITLLPNTSGVRTADEAIFAAHLSKELFGTTWLKLEVHPDPRYLLPDSIETLKACEVLSGEGFTVLPYCAADPVLCKRLEEAGAAAVMPLAAPIGSNRGLRTEDFIRIIIEQSCVPVVIDAGLGRPSDAARAMEMGADACLVNTAIAVSGDSVKMAKAFADAVQCGRAAFEAGIGEESFSHANASSPLTSFLD